VGCINPQNHQLVSTYVSVAVWIASKSP